MNVPPVLPDQGAELASKYFPSGKCLLQGVSVMRRMASLQAADDGGELRVICWHE